MKEVNNDSETALLLDPIDITATLKWSQFGSDWVQFTHHFKQLLAFGVHDVLKQTPSSFASVFHSFVDIEKQLAGFELLLCFEHFVNVFLQSFLQAASIVK